MFIIDYFRKIDGETIYREISDIIAKYRLHFDLTKEPNKRYKDFYNPFYQKKTNNRWFIRLGFTEFNGVVVPLGAIVRKHATITMSQDGLGIEPCCNESFSYGTGKGWEYNLWKWKKTKKELIKALDFSYDMYQKYEYIYQDWIDGSIDWNLIHFESMNRENRVKNKPGRGNERSAET